MDWTPGRVAQAHALIQRVLRNRGFLKTVEACDHIGAFEIVAKEHYGADLLTAAQSTVRLKVQADSAEAIAALADLGVENADDWPMFNRWA
jgi:hypothetical protein